MADSEQLIALIKDIIADMKRVHTDDVKDIYRRINEIEAKISELKMGATESKVKLAGLVAFMSLLAAAAIKFFFDVVGRVRIP